MQDQLINLNWRHVLIGVVFIVVIISSGSAAVTQANFTDSETTEATVGAAEAFPHFLVTNVDTNSPIQEDETLEVEATITNNGSVSTTQTIELHVEGQTNPVDSISREIAGGTSESVTLTWQPVDVPGGRSETFSVTVLTEDDSFVGSITVEGTGGPPDNPGRG